MSRLSLIWAIIEKDFLDSIKNKTVFFALVFPVLLSMVFRIVLAPGEISKLNIGMFQTDASGFVEYLEKESMGAIKINPVEDFEQGQKMLSEGKIFAILSLPREFDQKLKNNESPEVEIWVDSNHFTKAAIIENMVNKLIYSYAGRNPTVEVVTRNIQGQNFNPARAMLPTWLLFTILGGYMVVASSIIEEREKKTLQAILVTPCKLSDILIGKGVLGFVLTFVSSLLILGLNSGFSGNLTGIILIILLGSVFFATFGVLIGLLMPGQTTANTFGSIIYMGMFLPVVLADANSKMRIIARILPSYYINFGVREAMFSSVSLADLLPHFLFLVVGSLLVFIVSIRILKTRENL